MKSTPKHRQAKRAGDVVQTSCTLPKDVYEKLKTVADGEALSISAIIARACREFVDPPRAGGS